jgi:hypothetical protein
MPGGAIKIGKADDVERRLIALRFKYGPGVEILKVVRGSYPREKRLKARFADHRFTFTEQFRPVPALMRYMGLCPIRRVDPEMVEPAPSLVNPGLMEKAWRSYDARKRLNRGANA